MSYVLRNNAGEIVALYDKQDDIEAQWMDDDSLDVINFKNRLASGNRTEQGLIASDMELIRVLEDIVELLIKKQVFVFTELPSFAQSKLSKRQKLRSDMVSLTSLIGSSDDGIF